MGIDVNILKVFGQRLREQYSSDGTPLSWSIIDKLECLAEAEAKRRTAALSLSFENDSNPSE